MGLKRSLLKVTVSMASIYSWLPAMGVVNSTSVMSKKREGEAVSVYYDAVSILLAIGAALSVDFVYRAKMLSPYSLQLLYTNSDPDTSTA